MNERLEAEVDEALAQGLQQQPVLKAPATERHAAKTAVQGCALGSACKQGGEPLVESQREILAWCTGRAGEHDAAHERCGAQLAWSSSGVRGAS